MYRYLDRSVGEIEPVQRLLIWSMRSWVATLASGRCPCTALGPAFRGWGIEEVLSDFNTAMLVLNGEGQASLHFSAICCRQLSDDEARLLTLFDAGAASDAALLQRLSDQLVQPQAIWHLVTAVERVTAMLEGAPARWDSPRGAPPPMPHPRTAERPS